MCYLHAWSCIQRNGFYLITGASSKSFYNIEGGLKHKVLILQEVGPLDTDAGGLTGPEMGTLQTSPDILLESEVRFLSGEGFHRTAYRAEHHMRVPDPHGRKGAEEDEDKDSIRDGLWGTGEEGVGCGLRNCKDWSGGSE